MGATLNLPSIIKNKERSSSIPAVSQNHLAGDKDSHRSTSMPPRKKTVTICSKVNFLGDELKVDNFKANHHDASACSDPFERADDDDLGSFEDSPKMTKVQQRNQKISFN